MKGYRDLLGALVLASSGFSLAYPSTVEVKGLLVSKNGDTLSYSVQPIKPSPSTPGTLKPQIQDGRMTMEYRYRWTACRDGDQSVVVSGDSVLVRQYLNGSCIRSPQVYAFRADVNGLKEKNFTLAFQQVKAFQDNCNPPISTLASFNVVTASEKSPAHDSVAGSKGRLDFQKKMARETFRSGAVIIKKTSSAKFQIGALEDSLIGKYSMDTLILQLHSGKLEFQSTYKKSRCEDYGIGIRTSGDTIHVIHQDRELCNTASGRYGVRGKISDLPKGRYVLRVQARNRFGGICEKEAGIFHAREFVVP